MVTVGGGNGDNRIDATDYAVTIATAPERALEFFRILGNPIRAEIFRVMVTGLPMRGADVAARLDRPANSISYHMRQMANAGVIHKTDPPGTKDGRETWWIVDKEIRTGGNLRAVRELPGGDVAMEGFERVRAEPILDLFSLSRWMDAEVRGLPQDSMFGLADLTPKQARKFVDTVAGAVAEALAASRENNARLAEGELGSAEDGGEESCGPIIRYEYAVAVLPVDGAP